MAGPSAIDVLQRALELPPDERLAVATELLNSVEGPADAEWEEAWAGELKRRLAEVDRGEVQAVPWEAAKERILANLANK